VKRFSEQALIYWKFSRIVLKTSEVRRRKLLCSVYRITIASENLSTRRRTFASSILPTENLTCIERQFEACEYIALCIKI